MLLPLLLVELAPDAPEALEDLVEELDDPLEELWVLETLLVMLAPLADEAEDDELPVVCEAGVETAEEEEEEDDATAEVLEAEPVPLDMSTAAVSEPTLEAQNPAPVLAEES